MCFPVNFVNFLRTSVLRNTSGRLLHVTLIFILHFTIFMVPLQMNIKKDYSFCFFHFKFCPTVKKLLLIYFVPYCRGMLLRPHFVKNVH